MELLNDIVEVNLDGIIIKGHFSPEDNMVNDEIGYSGSPAELEIFEILDENGVDIQPIIEYIRNVVSTSQKKDITKKINIWKGLEKVEMSENVISLVKTFDTIIRNKSTQKIYIWSELENLCFKKMGNV